MNKWEISFFVFVLSEDGFFLKKIVAKFATQIHLNWTTQSD